MPLLDLLGTLTAAAFLAGSVALAVQIDRLEANGPVPAPEQEEPPLARSVPGGRPHLRLVHGTGR